jgi:hypothetical protein
MLQSLSGTSLASHTGNYGFIFLLSCQLPEFNAYNTQFIQLHSSLEVYIHYTNILLTLLLYSPDSYTEVILMHIVFTYTFSNLPLEFGRETYPQIHIYI